MTKRGSRYQSIRRSIGHEPSSDWTSAQDGDCFRLRNGFPRRVPRRGADRVSVVGHRCVASLSVNIRRCSNFGA